MDKKQAETFLKEMLTKKVKGFDENDWILATESEKEVHDAILETIIEAYKIGQTCKP